MRFYTRFPCKRNSSASYSYDIHLRRQSVRDPRYNAVQGNIAFKRLDTYNGYLYDDILTMSFSVFNDLSDYMERNQEQKMDCSVICDPSYRWNCAVHYCTLYIGIDLLAITIQHYTLLYGFLLPFLQNFIRKFGQLFLC